MMTTLLNSGKPQYPAHFQVERTYADHPNGTRLHYTDVTNPHVSKKGCALLLPGIFCTEVSEEVTARTFVDLGYSVRMPMLRGYGIQPERSTRGSSSQFGYGKEGMIAEDLPFLVEKTNEDFSQPITLLGFSSGALIAANYLSGAVAVSSRERPYLVRDEEAARQRSQRVAKFIDLAGPHGAPPLLLPHKIMLSLWSPLLALTPAYDLRSDAFLQFVRDCMLPSHLAMTLPMQAMPMALHPMALSLGIYMNPLNITHAEFMRLMYAGLGRAEHDHMVEFMQHLLGNGFSSENGYDCLASAPNLHVPTSYINGSCDRMVTPEQAKRAMDNMPAGVPRRQIVISGRGHLDLSIGEGAYNPLTKALSEALL